MNVFLEVFPWLIWLILAIVFLFYIVITISANRALLTADIKSVRESKDLDAEQKKNFEKSLLSGSVSARLARSNLMCVAGILSFILELLYATAEKESILTPNFYTALVVIFILMAVRDFHQYRKLNNEYQFYLLEKAGF